MNNTPVKTGKTYNLGGLIIEEVRIEPCYRVHQIMKGWIPSCTCTACKSRQNA